MTTPLAGPYYGAQIPESFTVGLRLSEPAGALWAANVMGTAMYSAAAVNVAGTAMYAGAGILPAEAAGRVMVGVLGGLLLAASTERARALCRQRRATRATELDPSRLRVLVRGLRRRDAVLSEPERLALEQFVLGDQFVAAYCAECDGRATLVVVRGTRVRRCPRCVVFRIDTLWEAAVAFPAWVTLLRVVAQAKLDQRARAGADRPHVTWHDRWPRRQPRGG